MLRYCCTRCQYPNGYFHWHWPWYQYQCPILGSPTNLLTTLRSDLIDTRWDIALPIWPLSMSMSQVWRMKALYKSANGNEFRFSTSTRTLIQRHIAPRILCVILSVLPLLMAPMQPSRPAHVSQEREHSELHFSEWPGPPTIRNMFSPIWTSRTGLMLYTFHQVSPHRQAIT